ncbi:recombination regulator RecX [Chitinimonas lacunae]|uniref:Regulatory protein RecX n=1 Tax=Chitinimonas lacunae TaxID=1963018 RepID=A0ABV8MN09_9NEIS
MADTLRDRALALLARREHSRAELRRKLGGGDEVESVLDELEARDWLSDARFAARYVESYRSRFGRRRLEYGLRERGIAESLIHEVLADTSDEDGNHELSRARTLWARKFGNPPADAREKARQVRFLQSRGFDFDIIRRVLGGEDDES